MPEISNFAVSIQKYFTETLTRNNDAFEALASKYRHFNGYTSAGPLSNGFLYLASGNTADWGYGALGVAGMALELGTAFYQDCEYFEASVIAPNLQVLTYAAKTSMAPYSLSKGPDVTSLSAHANVNSLTVTATASDFAWSSSDHPTSQQAVASILVSMDGYPIEERFAILLGGSSFTLDISNLPNGRHLVYVQGVDVDGYKGPVTAAYFTKDDTPPPTLPPVTDAPTLLPVTTAPTTPPPVFAAPTAVSPVTTAPNTAPPTCADTNYTEVCQWVSDNTENQPYFCDYFPAVASACPHSCNRC